MKISQWRNVFITWLTNQIVVDSYFLDMPDAVGKTNLFLPPLRNIKNYESDSGYNSTATQDIYITTRYSKDLDFWELPLNVIEGTYCQIAHSLLRQYQDINEDIIEVFINPSEDAITVGELGDQRGDWIVTMKYIVTIRLVFEPENEDQSILNISQVNIGLYKEKIDGTEKVLDQVLTTPGFLVDEGNSALTDYDGDLFYL